MRAGILGPTLAVLMGLGATARAQQPAKPAEPPKGPVARAEDLLWPKALPAPPRPEPPSSRTLLIGGALLLGIPYVSGATAAAVTGFANHSNWMLAPMFGPVGFALKRESGCSAETKGQLSCGDTWLSVTLIADAVLQTAGVGALLTGTVIALVPDSAPYLMGRVHVVPVASPSGAGVVLSL